MAVDTAAYRAEFRQKIWPTYSGRAHFTFTNLVLGALVVALLARLRHVQPLEWLAVPLSFLFANLIEYVAHRYPLHRPYPLGKYIYKAHGIQHHRFFTGDTDANMACDSNRDFFVILFGPVSQSILIGGVGLPAGLLVWGLTTLNVGLLFTATAVGYFLLYEWLHLIYHLPSTNLLTRLPGMRALRQHHLRHHELRLMTKFNFNITFPIFDAVLGTTWHAEESAQPAPGAKGTIEA
jgi:sterol desaturase/sphingolipid hydroxylase (fatty acid hydroxylase superfamily)